MFIGQLKVGGTESERLCGLQKQYRDGTRHTIHIRSCQSNEQAFMNETPTSVGAGRILKGRLKVRWERTSAPWSTCCP